MATPIIPDELLHKPRWQDQAACAGTPASLWFPERGEGPTISQAKAICGTCPVQGECLDYAVENRERRGIWGGVAMGFSDGNDHRAARKAIEAARRAMQAARDAR